MNISTLAVMHSGADDPVLPCACPPPVDTGTMLTVTSFAIPLVMALGVIFFAGALGLLGEATRRRLASKSTLVEQQPELRGRVAMLLAVGLFFSLNIGLVQWLLSLSSGSSSSIIYDTPRAWVVLLTLLPLITAVVITVVALAVSAFTEHAARNSSRLESVGDSV